MRLTQEQKYLASVMIWAVDNDYFNYGDRVIYLPKSKKYKVESMELDKPIYCRLGSFYHDWLKLDKEEQQNILENFKERNKDYEKIIA